MPEPSTDLPATEAVARELIAKGHTTEIRLATITRDRNGGDWIIDRLGRRNSDTHTHWLCAGKPVLAYATTHAVCATGRSIDDDLRPLVAATDQWQPVTLREILTYRSGFTMATGGQAIRVDDPPLTRPDGWDPTRDARYWNAGWELLPSVVVNATGEAFEPYVADVMSKHFDATSISLHRGAGNHYRNPAYVANPRIRGVYMENGIATSAGGTLSDLAGFLLGIASDTDNDGPRGRTARLLLSSNPGPDFFGTGISPHLRWSLGFPRHLVNQGFDRIAPEDAIGALGAVMVLIDRKPRYAWVLASGALPTSGVAFAVAMSGLNRSPDDRYQRIVAALISDLD